MIDYRTGSCGLGLIFRVRGSVFPRAVLFAGPSAGLTLLAGYMYRDVYELEPWDLSGFSAVWSGFTFVLGFLVVFRTQQAYARYWEGATLLRQCRGEWFNATSSVVAFCTLDRERQAEVEEFQHLLIRLMSMLHCVGLQTIADMEDDHFDFIDIQGVDEGSLCFLASLPDKNQRCEVIIQWVQQLVVRNMGSGILPIPPPVMTRFFQELSRGAVNVTQARNMTDIPFPFPYAQLLTLMLIIYWLITPFVNCMILRPPWSCLFTFVSVLAFWGTSLIAAEIESPFGDDPNDLPLSKMQDDMNTSLWLLLEKQTQTPPKFTFERHTHRRWVTRCATFSVVDGKEIEQRSAPLETLAPMDAGSERSRRPSMISIQMGHIGSLRSVASMASAETRKKHGRKKHGRYHTARHARSHAPRELGERADNREDRKEDDYPSERPSDYISERSYQQNPPTSEPRSPSSFIARQAAAVASMLAGDAQSSLASAGDSFAQPALGSRRRPSGESAAGRRQPQALEKKLGADLLGSCALDIPAVQRRELDQQLTKLGGCMEEYISQIFVDVVQRQVRPMILEREDAGQERQERPISHGRPVVPADRSARISSSQRSSRLLSERSNLRVEGATSARRVVPACDKAPDMGPSGSFDEPVATPRFTPRED